MDNWAKRGRPIVREALNHAWEVIDRELQDELARRAADHAANEELLKTRLATIEALQEENRKLRAQIAAMSSSSSTTCSATPTTENEMSASTCSEDVPASSIAPAQPIPASTATKTPPPASTETENAELVKSKLRFNALADNFKKAKEALRKRKDERDLWKDRAKMLESQVRAFEEKHGIRVLEQQEDGRPEEAHETRSLRIRYQAYR